MGDATDREESLGRVVARGAGIGILGGVVNQVVVLATYVTLARLAAPEVFGTFAAASILVAAAGLFIESGMTAALVHRSDRIEEAAATAFLATLLSGVGLCALSAVLAPVVGLVFDREGIVAVALALAGLNILNALEVVPYALLQRRFAYVRRALTDPVWMTSYGAAAAAGLLLGWGVWALVVAAYVSGVVRVVLVWCLVGRRLRLRLASLEMWRELARYGRHVLASEILRHAGRIAHTIGIGRFLSVQDLGQFNFGNQIATQSGTPFLVGTAMVFFPAFTRMSDDRPRLIAAFLRGLASLAFLTVPVSLGFLAFGESLLVLLLGRRWEPAGEVLSSLCLVGAAFALVSICTEVLKATGRPDRLPRIHLLSGVAPIAAVAFGISFGIVVVGALTSVGLALVGVFALATTRPVVGCSTRDIVSAVVPPVAVASAVAGLFFFVEREVVDSASHGTAGGLLRLGLQAVVAGAVYVGIMRVVAPGITRELQSSLRHLRRRREI